MKKNIVWLVVALITLSACEVKIDGEKIVGSGKSITEQRPVTAFTELENQSFFDIVITKGDKDEVEITGDDNLVPEIETVVESNKLIVRNKSKSFNFSWKDTPGIIKIKAAHLDSLDNSGSGDIELRDLHNDKFSLTSNSSGDIKVSGEVQSLSLTSNGSGDLKLDQLSILQANI